MELLQDIFAVFITILLSIGMISLLMSALDISLFPNKEDDNDIENEGDNKTDLTITIHLSNKK